MSNVKLGINGFGRIGRILFRIANERNDVEIVGVNDLLEVDQLAHLLKYDSVHGRFEESVEVKNGNLVVNGNEIRVTSETDPKDLKWDAIGAEVVLECTGIFKTKDDASQHLEAGAKKVVISAPSKDAPTYVMGVNHKDASADEKVVSCASCTTNCLAPLAKAVNDAFGIEEGLMTTVHSATATQSTVDVAAKKNKRIGRSALNNIIPTSTGAAIAVTKAIPELEGKLTGMAFRVPTPDVSVVDLTVRTKESTSFDNLKQKIKETAEGEMKGVLGYTEAEVVSTDFIGEGQTSVFDADVSMSMNDNFFKLISWYDNEYGFSTKLLELSIHMGNL